MNDWMGFHAFALSYCIEGALESFFYCFHSVASFDVKTDFILHDFDSSACVHEIQWS